MRRPRSALDSPFTGKTIRFAASENIPRHILAGDILCETDDAGKGHANDSGQKATFQRSEDTETAIALASHTAAQSMQPLHRSGCVA